MQVLNWVPSQMQPAGGPEPRRHKYQRLLEQLGTMQQGGAAAIGPLAAAALPEAASQQQLQHAEKVQTLLETLHGLELTLSIAQRWVCTDAAYIEVQYERKQLAVRKLQTQIGDGVLQLQRWAARSIDNRNSQDTRSRNWDVQRRQQIAVRTKIVKDLKVGAHARALPGVCLADGCLALQHNA